jgi:hypothetical protein
MDSSSGGQNFLHILGCPSVFFGVLDSSGGKIFCWPSLFSKSVKKQALNGQNLAKE